SPTSVECGNRRCTTRRCPSSCGSQARTSVSTRASCPAGLRRTAASAFPPPPRVLSTPACGPVTPSRSDPEHARSAPRLPVLVHSADEPAWRLCVDALTQVRRVRLEHLATRRSRSPSRANARSTPCSCASVEGLAGHPDVALARVWLLGSRDYLGHLPHALGLSRPDPNASA